MKMSALPKEISARAITTGLARAAGSVNAVLLVTAIPLLIEFMIARGIADRSPIPLLILAVLATLAIMIAIRPTALVFALFLGCGTVGAIAFQVILLSIYPSILAEDGMYLLSRPAVVLVFAGVMTKTIRGGIIWLFVGFGLSNLVSFCVALIVGIPFAPGYGPVFTLAPMLITYVVFAAIQARLRSKTPDFGKFEKQTERVALEEGLRMRMTAAVHDTLLNDLSLVVNAPDELDDRMRQRLRDDVHTYMEDEWLSKPVTAVVAGSESELYSRVAEVVSAMKWRGLTVDITGSEPIDEMSASISSVVVDAVQACLENVLRHSGTTAAELNLAFSERTLTVTISDRGVGFDPDCVAPDRLGLRASVFDRVRAVGGMARVWSTPGEGTSVVMTVPIRDVSEKELHSVDF